MEKTIKILVSMSIGIVMSLMLMITATAVCEDVTVVIEFKEEDPILFPGQVFNLRDNIKAASYAGNDEAIDDVLIFINSSPMPVTDDNLTIPIDTYEGSYNIRYLLINPADQSCDVLVQEMIILIDDSLELTLEQEIISKPVGTTFDEAYFRSLIATAKNSESDDVIADIIIDFSSVDSSVVDSYTVTYTLTGKATDGREISTTKTLTVNITAKDGCDDVTVVLELESDTLYLLPGQSYNLRDNIKEASYIDEDDVKDEVQILINGEPIPDIFTVPADTNEVFYIIGYLLENPADPSCDFLVKEMVILVDNSLELTLKEESVSEPIGTILNEAYFRNLIDIATISGDDAKSDVVIDFSFVDSSKVGSYTVTYTLTGDGLDGEVSITKTLTVYITATGSTTPPTSPPSNSTPPLTINDPFVYLNGSNSNTTSTPPPPASDIKDAVINAKDVKLNVGDAFDFMKGVTAKDDGGKGKDITNEVTVTGNVNTSVAGKYTMTYKVTGANGRTVTKRITVTFGDKVVKTCK